MPVMPKSPAIVVLDVMDDVFIYYHDFYYLFLLFMYEYYVCIACCSVVCTRKNPL